MFFSKFVEAGERELAMVESPQVFRAVLHCIYTDHCQLDARFDTHTSTTSVSLFALSLTPPQRISIVRWLKHLWQPKNIKVCPHSLLRQQMGNY
jgi:hypothetical protein